MYDIESEMMSFNPNLVTNTRNNLNAWGSFFNDIVHISKMYAITKQKSYENDYELLENDWKNEKDKDKQTEIKNKQLGMAKTIRNFSFLTGDIDTFSRFDKIYKQGNAVNEAENNTELNNDEKKHENLLNNIIDSIENNLHNQINIYDEVDIVSTNESRTIYGNDLNTLQKISIISTSLKEHKISSKESFSKLEEDVLKYFNVSKTQYETYKDIGDYKDYKNKIEVLLKNNSNRKIVNEIDKLNNEITKIRDEYKDTNPIMYKKYDLLLYKLKKAKHIAENKYKEINSYKK